MEEGSKVATSPLHPAGLGMLVTDEQTALARA
jgi:hypothetical protein